MKLSRCDNCGTEMGDQSAGTTDGPAHIMRVQPYQGCPPGEENYIQIIAFKGSHIHSKTSDKRSDICLRCVVQASLFVAEVKGIKKP